MLIDLLALVRNLRTNNLLNHQLSSWNLLYGIKNPAMNGRTSNRRCFFLVCSWVNLKVTALFTLGTSSRDETVRKWRAVVAAAGSDLLAARDIPFYQILTCLRRLCQSLWNGYLIWQRELGKIKIFMVVTERPSRFWWRRRSSCDGTISSSFSASTLQVPSRPSPAS